MAIRKKLSLLVFETERVIRDSEKAYSPRSFHDPTAHQSEALLYRAFNLFVAQDVSSELTGDGAGQFCTKLDPTWAFIRCE
jgi:hypothetical protein